MAYKFWHQPFLKLFSRVILFSILIFLISFPFVSASSDQEEGDTPVVEEKLKNQMARNGSVGYMIYFEDQPDLSAAYAMDWEERGEFVMNALQTSAEKSQQEVRDYLDKRGVKYETFWIENIIIVEKSNRVVFNGLMSFPEIESLRAMRTMALVEPKEISTSSINEALSIELNISHVGAPDVWGLGFTGEGIVVANIDTGVRYTHQALLPHYRGNLGGSYDHNYNWWDPFAAYPSYPVDTYGHGTHTMGIMIGDDNSGNQIGMAPGAKWMACRGCSNTSCPNTELLKCAQFLLAPWDLNGNNADPDKRPNIINNSWGNCDTAYDDWFQEAVDAWQAAGIYPIFSNGNASNCSYPTPPGLNTVGNPARYGNVTSVGSTGKSDGAYATHSTWGPTDNADTINPRGYPYLKPQVLAPGVSIRSSYKNSDTEYQGMTGTSMSAPHVSGLVALMWDAAPCLIGDYAHTETIIEETATAIPYASGGTPPPGPGNVPNYATGWGEIDALAATQAAIVYCGGKTLSGTVTDSLYNQPLADVLISATGSYTDSTHTNSIGNYTLTLISGVYTVTASAYGYVTEVITDVDVSSDTTLDISLDLAPLSVVSGTVTDEDAGWPVYTQLTIDGYPGDPIWTNPINGQYSIELPQGTDFTFATEDFWASYISEEASTGVLSGDTTLDFSINISDAICTAPGYNQFTLLSETFDSGVKPTGWTVIDNAGSGAIWTFNNPGSKTNKTGGSGLFADANSDYAGYVNMNTELRTPLLDFTGYTRLTLAFKYDWYVYHSGGGSEVGDVDISVNGSSGPWINLWERTMDNTYDRGPKTASIDLSSYSGLNNVMLRFHYYDANNDWWWQIDDVIISTGCESYSGGLVAGNIYDGETSTALNDVVVSNDDALTTTSLPTPDDDNVDDGFYTIFSADGTHTITATLDGYQTTADSVGVIVSDTVQHDFTLYVPLEAEFSASPTSGSPPLTVNFTDASSGFVSDWLWDFGDGITNTLQNPSHIYSGTGFYTVTLDINGPGGSDQENKPNYIAVAYPPVAGFNASPTSGIAPFTVYFTDTSSGTISTRAWDFGDGITSTLKNPNHLYSSDGVYTISLLVTGPGGSDREEKPDYITVYETPAANFTATPTFGHKPLTVAFMDTSSGSVTSWLWDFGDGQTSTLQNPSHEYSLNGVYTVSLVVNGPVGDDQVEKTGYIRIGYGSFLPTLLNKYISILGFP